MEYDLEHYLKKQMELNKELIEILQSMNQLQKEQVSIEQSYTKELQDLDRSTKEVLVTTKDTIQKRFEFTKQQVNLLLTSEEAINNREFQYYLMNTKEEIRKIEDKMNQVSLLFHQKSQIAKQQVSIPKPMELPKPIVTTQEVKKETLTKKLEFKFGTIAMNTIGVLLVLIAFILFGKNVYNQIISPMIKGISLFVLSSTIVLVSELFIKRKYKLLAIGLSALGIGTLYVALIINYLVLDTLSATSAMIITVIITILSIWISQMNQSILIHSISLIGGYSCLIPMERLGFTASIITVTILLFITASALFTRIRSKLFNESIPFEIYALLMSFFFYVIFIGFNRLDLKASMVYTLVSYLIFILFYLKTNPYSILKQPFVHLSFIIISTIMYWISPIVYHSNNRYILLFTYLIINILVWIYLYLKKTVTIPSILVLLNVLNITLLYGKYNLTSIVIAVSLLFFYFLYNKTKDIYSLITMTIVLYLSIMNYLSIQNVLPVLAYFIAYTSLSIHLSSKLKNKVLLLFTQLVYLGITLLFVSKFYTMDYIPSLELIYVLLTLVPVSFLLLFQYVPIYKQNVTKEINGIFLVVTLLLTMTMVVSSIYYFLLLFSIGLLSIVYFISNERVLPKDLINEKEWIIYSYITISFINLYISLLLIEDYSLSPLVVSGGFMSLALVSILRGFKRSKNSLRIYGLVLAFITAIKSILFDLNAFSFQVRTLLFLLVGILSIFISYIYSRIEKQGNKV